MNKIQCYVNLKTMLSCLLLYIFKTFSQRRILCLLVCLYISFLCVLGDFCIKACLFCVFCSLSLTSLVHLCWCLLMALSETWDVYSSTARKAAQGVCFSERAKITNCHRDMGALPSCLLCFNVCFAFFVSVKVLCVWVHIGLRTT